MLNPAAADAAAPAAQESRCDVLIVDDSGASREILASLLRQVDAGLQIRQARDAAQALGAWLELFPRATFLDIDMPDQDGLTLLKTLRRSRPDAFVVMVSGYSSADNVRQALAMGANGFVVKPYKPQRIVDMLDRYQALTGRKLGARG
ncbi:MAG: response regulator [Burkholderiales bacterium]|nr:response regulator [Burkholderiales bacterium]MDE1925743.1 response regulator [Burkholderiales bacterium]MDE2157991.1 response regulator [Burkholderiales bacterium]MDE2502579.1 response regulator [Burkholderiales bacterium]